MSAAEPGAPNPDSPAGAPWRTRWRTLLPHLLTAAAAVALSLGIQAALSGPAAPAPAPTLTAPTARPTPPPTRQPTPPPAQPPLSQGITSQEIAALQAEDDRLWTAIYLSRAISQIAEAEADLRANDLAAVDQALIAVDDSLALAYRRASDSQSDPIAQLRRDTSAAHEDLFLRPEGMDARLARLRQTILALIEGPR
ncbi:MAG TPA: hypothetical protein VNL77_15550 [Roseiflexaceae bacterium]|nr:hypothetical protein [Roseiflexaceae bacterium]